MEEVAVRKMKIATSLILAAHGLPEEDDTEPPCWVLNSTYVCVYACACAHACVEDREQQTLGGVLKFTPRYNCPSGGKVLKTPDVKMEIKTTECSEI